MEFKYTDEQIAEIIRCRDDALYFIDTYVMVGHPAKGYVPFELYPHQADTLEQIQETGFHVIGAARQTGTSAMLLAYSLWYSLFHTHRTTGLVTYRLESGVDALRLILEMYDQLPEWMQPKLRTRNRTHIEFENGCKILAARAGDMTFKGWTINLLVWLDAAFSKDSDARAFWYSIAPVLLSSRQAKCIIASTFPPEPRGNLFMEIYNGAVAGNNSFKAHTFKWWYVPGRTREWKAHQIAIMGKAQWDTEYGLTHGKA